MAAFTAASGPYEAAWNQIVIELRSLISRTLRWMETLGFQEQVLGLCVFVLVLLILILMMSRKKQDPGGPKRQFAGALALVIIFSFGTGWSLDTSAGSLSHLFGR